MQDVGATPNSCFLFCQGPSCILGQFHLSKFVVPKLAVWSQKKKQGIGAMHELAAHQQLGGGLESVLFSSPKHETMTPIEKAKFPAAATTRHRLGDL